MNKPQSSCKVANLFQLAEPCVWKNNPAVKLISVKIKK